jgi:hypothetical protein
MQSPVSLTGTYETTSGAFSLRGGAFTVNATVREEVATGTIVTPTGTGTVAALLSPPGLPATRYCGTYRGTSTGSTGKFLFVERGGLVSGIAAQDGVAQPLELAGRVLNNLVAVSWSWEDRDGTGRGSAQGTITGSTASGTWSNSDHETGTWSGNSVGC